MTDWSLGPPFEVGAGWIHGPDPDNPIRRLADEVGAMLIRNYAAPAFFSAAAFRYYMPAFMGWPLDQPDSPEYVVEATIRAFDPGGPADELYPFLVSKFALFDAAQRRAVTLFLDAFADDDELGGLARAALRNHWYGAGGADTP
jgi:hypothetical protein